MARCPNKNTPEYKALQEVYKSEIATNNIINTWQDANNTDVFPTVVEAEQFAKYIYNKVNEFVLEETNNRVRVTQVKFKENEKNSAKYGE